MFVLGLSTGIKAGHHDGGAVLLEDGRLVAASEEERFTLAKHARGELPRRAIGFCLKEAGIRIEDVDWVCSPLRTYPHYDERISEWMAFQFGYSPPVELFDHHRCHAASTFYGSGFAEATVLCLDYSGDGSSGLVAHARGGDFREITRFPRRNSLGLYYGMMTQYLGYQMTNDEYKVMGLASYGEPRFMEEFDRILRPVEMGYELASALDKQARDARIFTTDFSTRQERIFTETLEEILGPRRVPGHPIEERHRDIAASLQHQLEKVVLNLLEDALEDTGCPDVCLAGGVALNSKANMHVARHPRVARLYVPPVPHDAGVALGAAMLKSAEEGHAVAPLTHAYWGPSYGRAEIRRHLDRVGATYRELTDPVAECVADLARQRTVGWFQGRMEFGPRALGNRSILADPSDAGIKDRINARIKYREEFRPFAPSVLVEAQENYFEDSFDSPFMMVTLPALERAKCEAPATTHVDGTSRIQSVSAETNPLYHELLTRFAEDVGPPILLNTSLNINEQPMVTGPLEALHTFYCSGLDVLYLEAFRIEK